MIDLGEAQELAVHVASISGFDIIAVRRVSRVPDRHARVVIAVVPVLDQLTHVCCIDCILMPASCGGA